MSKKKGIVPESMIESPSVPEQEGKGHGDLDQLQVDSLKEKHGKIMCVTVEVPGEKDQYFWFKKPTVQILSAIAKVSIEDPAKGTEVMFSSCLIRGNDKIVTEDIDVWANLSNRLEELIESYNTKVKKF